MLYIEVMTYISSVCANCGNVLKNISLDLLCTIHLCSLGLKWLHQNLMHLSMHAMQCREHTCEGCIKEKRMQGVHRL